MAILPLSIATTRTFKMVSNATLIAGLTPTVLFSKAGAAFVTPSGAVAGIANGWYKIALTTGDLNTNGDLSFYVTGAGADDTDWVDQVVSYNPYDAKALGLTYLDTNMLSRLAAASTAANWSAVSINAAGRVDVGNYQGVTAVTDSTTSRPDVNVNFVRGSSINTLISGRVDANAQVVGDKTGYSLSQAFPSNFSALSVNAAGRVDVGLFSGFAVDTGSTNRPTVNVDFVRSSSINVLKSGRLDVDGSAVATTAGTVNDKTGYSLSQTFPTNFSSLSIDANGRVLYANTVNLLKNQAINAIPFMMISSADHISGWTSATVAAQRSIDGGAFANAANSVAEVGTGWYKINLNASDLNGNTIAFKFTAAGCDVTNIGIVTNV